MSISISQLQKDQESIISDYTERFENMNCYLEEIQTDQIQILETRINQLLERIEKLEKFVTGSKDYFPVINRDFEDRD
jgi:cob(I)alamin adenosyltransferase